VLLRYDESMAHERNSAEWQQHLAAIRKIVEAWLDGEMNVEAKRDAIMAENKFFHGRERRSRATGEQLTTITAGGVALAEREPQQGDAFEEEEEREEWWKR